MRKSLKIVRLMSWVFAGLFGLAIAPGMADDAGGLKKSAIVDQLIKQTGVYDRSKTGKTPDFVVDPDLATAPSA